MWEGGWVRKGCINSQEQPPSSVPTPWRSAERPAAINWSSRYGAWTRTAQSTAKIWVKRGSRDSPGIGTSYSFKTQNLILYHMATLACRPEGGERKEVNVVCSIMSGQGDLVQLSVSGLVCQWLHFTGASGKHTGHGKLQSWVWNVGLPFISYLALNKSFDLSKLKSFSPPGRGDKQYLVLVPLGLKQQHRIPCWLLVYYSQLQIHPFCLLSEQGYGPFQRFPFTCWHNAKLHQQRVLERHCRGTASSSTHPKAPRS